MLSHETASKTGHDMSADSNDAVIRDSVEVDAGGREIGSPFIREIELASGELVAMPSIHVNQARLFHGSTQRGIKKFDTKKSEGRQSIGSGFYFAPLKETATQYVDARSDGGSGAVYEVGIKDIDLADLRSPSGKNEFLRLFRREIAEELGNNLPGVTLNDPVILSILKEGLRQEFSDVVDGIDNGTLTWGKFRNAVGTKGFGNMYITQTLSKYGYGGLVDEEGEPPKVDWHDSIVIFDPSDVDIISETEA